MQAGRAGSLGRVWVEGKGALPFTQHQLIGHTAIVAAMASCSRGDERWEGGQSVASSNSD